MKDLKNVTTYLHDLSEHHCISLGEALGLNYPNLCRMNHYPQDVVAAWLRQEDDVYSTCLPTWRNLARALNKIDQNGIATKVRDEH